VLGHGEAHPPDADDADPFLCVRHALLRSLA
jgi:hypothetical protein